MANLRKIKSTRSRASAVTSHKRHYRYRALNPNVGAPLAVSSIVTGKKIASKVG